ncbi:hypothetical protein ONA91_31075, partial [Micromonospora sp. DR5-3]|uniref:hypothetical protein n=1 Tax=Micromonospora sp. DR5-3 TaxID=2992129 RepID=UPI00222ECAA8
MPLIAAQRIMASDVAVASVAAGQPTVGDQSRQDLAQDPSARDHYQPLLAGSLRMVRGVVRGILLEHAL